MLTGTPEIRKIYPLRGFLSIQLFQYVKLNIALCLETPAIVPDPDNPQENVSTSFSQLNHL